MRYQGLLYRCLNPIFAADPLAGEGARRYGGRFNPKGTAALYTSTSIATAIRESQQVGHLQPTMLVSYATDLFPVFDATAPQALADYGMTEAGLAAADWRDDMRLNGTSQTQHLAERLIADGYVGMRVRSFAQGAQAHDLNMVLWTWLREGARITLIDDEGRLNRPPA